MYEKVDPIQIIEMAYSHTNVCGSSTFIIGVLDGEYLKCANLGDSGFLHFKKHGDIYYFFQKSNDQTHDFNTPYQLLNLPTHSDLTDLRSRGMIEQADTLENNISRKEKTVQNLPCDAECINIELSHGDIIIMCSDGVLDNLFNYDIEKMINKYYSEMEVKNNSEMDM